MPEVVESAETFASQLQGLVVYQQLRAATLGESLLTALERNRIRLQRVRTRLEGGQPPATAIFETNGS